MHRQEWKGKAGTLSWFFQESGETVGSPGILCIAENEAEAQMCLQTLHSLQKKAFLAAVVIPGDHLAPWEEDVGDLVAFLRQQPKLDETRLALTGAPGGANSVWRLASHFPQWFSGVCAVGGYGNPYHVRALKDVPLLAVSVEGEDLPSDEEEFLVGVERLVMGLRTAGSRQVECRREGPCSREEAWNRAFLEGGAGEWLLAQDRKKQFQVHWLLPGVWRIDDYFTASCYLVEGRDKALLVDTGMGEGDLAGLTASLTNLPVEVAITHPHLDHMHGIDRFSAVYLHRADREALLQNPQAFPGALSSPSASLPPLLPLDDGARIDLGGDIWVEALELPGHTPHSMVFADGYHRCLFTGDALGSGYIVLLICPEKEALSLVGQYQKALERFSAQLPRLRDYAWLGGHGIQENGCDDRRQQDYLAGCSHYFNPIRAEVVHDMLSLCQALLSGEIPWEQVQKAPDHYCSRGSAGIFFRFS